MVRSQRIRCSASRWQSGANLARVMAPARLLLDLALCDNDNVLAGELLLELTDESVLNVVLHEDRRGLTQRNGRGMGMSVRVCVGFDGVPCGSS